MRSNLAPLTPVVWILDMEWSELMGTPQTPASHRPNRAVRIREWNDETGFAVAIRGGLSPKNTRLRLSF